MQNSCPTNSADPRLQKKTRYFLNSHINTILTPTPKSLNSFIQIFKIIRFTHFSSFTSPTSYTLSWNSLFFFHQIYYLETHFNIKLLSLSNYHLLAGLLLKCCRNKHFSYPPCLAYSTRVYCIIIILFGGDY